MMRPRKLPLDHSKMTSTGYGHAPHCQCGRCVPVPNNIGPRPARPEPKPAQKAAVKSKPRSAPAKRSSAKAAKR